ncbi:unnamed protein product [Moneuplotes crassus]|uniref:Uncharacterized protein n=1 Tax=Euplotes crassus TaxID=5936 RepID=A0AAD1XX79_EUPCR|nr:unnamed protein product [Moneuplotes crassus]
MEGDMIQNEKQLERYLQDFKLELYKDIYKIANASILLCFSKTSWSINTTKRDTSNLFVRKIKPIGIKHVFNMFINQQTNLKHFNIILKSSIIRKIERLEVTANFNRKLQAPSYIRLIINLLPKVTKVLCLKNCQISASQFRKIILAGRHIETLEFRLYNFLPGNFDYQNSLITQSNP